MFSLNSNYSLCFTFVQLLIFYFILLFFTSVCCLSTGLITFCIKCYLVCNTNIRQACGFTIEAKLVVLKLSSSYHLEADQMSTCVAPFCIKCYVLFIKIVQDSIIYNGIFLKNFKFFQKLLQKFI